MVPNKISADVPLKDCLDGVDRERPLDVVITLCQQLIIKLVSDLLRV